MKLLDLATRAPLTPGRAHLDLRENAGSITWSADQNGIVLRLSGKGGNVLLELGPDAVAQLKQALSWSGDVRRPRLQAYRPA